MVNGKDSKNGQKKFNFRVFYMKILLSLWGFWRCFPFFATINISYICKIKLFKLSGRGKILCYSDLISDLTVYIGVQLRGPSHRGASQPGFPRLKDIELRFFATSRKISNLKYGRATFFDFDLWSEISANFVKNRQNLNLAPKFWNPIFTR